MDENRIAFIICTNKMEWYKECVKYIQKLYVPDDFEIEILQITQVSSMTSGYNEGMHSSNAKYKIYMHQDVFIIQKDFLENMIKIFKKNKEIGIMGVLGTNQMIKNAIYWDKWDLGACYAFDVMQGYKHDFWEDEQSIKMNYSYAQALDGMLLMTQYDVEWREDLFMKWDFYDVSASFEFMRQGYRVAVMRTNEIAVIHDCGYSKLEEYDESREKFCEEYSEFGFVMNEEMVQLPKKEVQIEDIQYFDELMEEDKAKAQIYLNELVKEYRNTDIYTLWVAFDIYLQEKKRGSFPSFVHTGERCQDIVNKYTKYKFLIRAVELDICEEAKEELYFAMMNESVSLCAIENIANRCCISPINFYNKIMNGEK